MVGTLIGVLPGIGPVATIAMLLPITFHLPPTAALIMLAGIYYGAQYGGSTTSILVNLPGEASSVVTCLDGYQMARKGRAGAALAIAALGSFFAGTVGTISSPSSAPPLTRMAQKFGPADYCLADGARPGRAPWCWRAARSSRRSPWCSSACCSAWSAPTSTTGAQRFTFGVPELRDGIDFAPIAMGLFGIAEIVNNLERRMERNGARSRWARYGRPQEIQRSIPAVLRGTALGSILGVLPGGGPTLGVFSAYTLERSSRKHPERFGKGASRAWRRRKSANNAAAQTSFIPMLTLGIPSNAVMALMVGAMIIQGIQPGPAGHDQEAGPVLGHDRLDVDRQPDAGHHQPADDRHVGEAADAALSLPLSRPSCCSAASAPTACSNSTFHVLHVAMFGVLGYIFVQAGLRAGALPARFGAGPA